MESPKQLNVLFIGHSYVRRAREYRQKKNLTHSILISNYKLNFFYFWIGGQNYTQFNSNPNTLAGIKNVGNRNPPDIILVCLAGNAVARPSSFEMPLANHEMRVFHEWVKTSFPSAKLIPIEAEPRFNYHSELPKDHGKDGVIKESYKSRRVSMNSAIKRDKSKDALCQLYNELNDIKYFIPYERNPYVHLNDEGYELYWKLIINCLTCCLGKWDI